MPIFLLAGLLPASGGAWPQGDDTGFLLPHSRVRELSRSMDASGLLRYVDEAFGGRHVVFLGDSTMSGFYHHLAAVGQQRRTRCFVVRRDAALKARFAAPWPRCCSPGRAAVPLT